MADLVPALVGTAGLVVGECFVLTDGADVVVGRSRSCDISLRRAAGYLKAPADIRDSDHDFNTVSRRHLRLSVNKGVAKLQDLSTNGTFFNEQPLEQSTEVDLNAGPCTVRLGTRECFQLLLLSKDDPRVGSQPSGPVSTLADDDKADASAPAGAEPPPAKPE